ncbi:MAG: Methyltransferase type 11 [Candidatus Magasanikbacteria bacterium GW2011_GWA2_56_11]|uniref:Methyltransferase type 11 n=1 Tax=Candidatus Magasanikbacteria bacterium GW2011_GWA2_56_11 TaxID=1619044 RepID=A0A0G2BAL8_9BACT|nr:MAG: Methyltransferase type 11 [Candidatus Magasanikbacteria bacterium GW2011_GWA2_56_11]
MKKDTSWEEVAGWYGELVEETADTYHSQVILPHLLRLLPPKRGERWLDIGCGTGFFTRAMANSGALITGIDASREMIAQARTRGDKNADYRLASADKLTMFAAGTFDTVTIILALQNIEDLGGTVAEAARVLKPDGRLAVVLNHPAFRIPRASGWEWTDDKKIQSRRVDRYLSDAKIKIIAHPGENNSPYTISFHRPLQSYFKALHKSGLAVTRLEEWISHRRGPKGKTFLALETARKEIPLFLFFEARQI